jgi:hypothetical protein
MIDLFWLTYSFACPFQPNGPGLVPVDCNERGEGSLVPAEAQGRTRQIVGQMIGDDQMENEGKDEERRTEMKVSASGAPPQNKGKKE